MDLSVVVVNTNTRQLLEDCLNSIYQNTSGIEFEVIVVDNNSTDGSAEMVRSRFPDVTLIRNDRNMGFSASNNRGFEQSSGRYVLALNPDTIILDDCLRTMVRFMDDHPEAGASGCLTFNADGETVQSTYECFPSLLSELFYTTPLKRLFPHELAEDHGDYLEVDWVQGSFLILRRTALEEVGLFDEERFSPLYSEETDLCYRIKRAGWRIYYVPSANIIHLYGQTTKLMDTWFFLQLHKSKFEFFKKHYGALYAQAYRCLRALACLARASQLSARSVMTVGNRKNVRDRLRLQLRLFRFLLKPSLTMPPLS